MKPPAPVCILGVGRSGTTGVYHALQRIFTTVYGGVSFRSVYEPFLWDAAAFDAPYEEVAGRFSTMESVSIEGIHQHLHLPMFITDPAPHIDNEFLRGLFDGGGMPVLLKFNRANGRYRLLKAVAPETKFVFLIRNPLDVVNSVIGKFSFFGGEFHKDDYPRFAAEVERMHGAHLSTPPENLALRLAEYWYHMNRFALESIGPDDRCLRICHEDYLAQKPRFVGMLADLVRCGGIAAEELPSSDAPVGPLTRDVLLTGGEIDAILPFVDRYKELLAAYFPETDRGFPDRLIERYHAGARQKPTWSAEYSGKTPLFLKDEALRLKYPKPKPKDG